MYLMLNILTSSWMCETIISEKSTDQFHCHCLIKAGFTSAKLIMKPFRSKKKGQLEVIFGKPTKYTACLMFADEDYEMAQRIVELYDAAYEKSTFFVPQFDLKFGKYELDTTARVIDERCGRKVIFLLSEHFVASEVCQFAVNYTAAHGTGRGNLIPFLLSKNTEHIPPVLKGISGIRWFREASRKTAWGSLTESLLSGKEELEQIKLKICEIVGANESKYLSDPADTPPAGNPFPVVDPSEPPVNALSQRSDHTSFTPDSEGLSPLPRGSFWTRFRRVIGNRIRLINRHLRRETQRSQSDSNLQGSSSGSSIELDTVSASDLEYMEMRQASRVPSNDSDMATQNSVNVCSSDKKLREVAESIKAIVEVHVHSSDTIPDSSGTSCANCDTCSQCISNQTGTELCETNSIKCNEVDKLINPAQNSEPVQTRLPSDSDHSSIKAEIIDTDLEQEPVEHEACFVTAGEFKSEDSESFETAESPTELLLCGLKNESLDDLSYTINNEGSRKHTDVMDCDISNENSQKNNKEFFV